MHRYQLSLFALAAATSLTAADLPYAGKWKMNAANSELSGSSWTIRKLPSGEWQSEEGGISYKFKMDGKDYSDGLGCALAWTSVDAHTWQAINKTNGKFTSTDTIQESGNGRTLTVHTTGTKPDGSPLDETTLFARVSGGPGLAGTWKMIATKSSSPEVLELVPYGSDGLTFKEPAWGLTCNAKFDGKDYPCTGPTMAAGFTVAMTKRGTRRLELLRKYKGKPFFKETLTVSADNKTVTSIGETMATNEKIKVVYDRQ